MIGQIAWFYKTTPNACQESRFEHGNTAAGCKVCGAKYEHGCLKQEKPVEKTFCPRIDATYNAIAFNSKGNVSCHFADRLYPDCIRWAQTQMMNGATKVLISENKEVFRSPVTPKYERVLV